LLLQGANQLQKELWPQLLVLPRLPLWVQKVKTREQMVRVQMEETRCIVSHSVGYAGDVIHPLEIPMLPLMEAGFAEEI
jgi:hypothetical protein